MLDQSDVNTSSHLLEVLSDNTFPEIQSYEQLSGRPVYTLGTNMYFFFILKQT